MEEEKKNGGKVLKLMIGKSKKNLKGENDDLHEMMKEDALFLFRKKDAVERLLSSLLVEFLRNDNFQEIWTNLEKRMEQFRLLRTLSVLDSFYKKLNIRNIGLPDEVVEWLFKVDDMFVSFFKNDFLRVYIEIEKGNSCIRNEWKDLRWGTFSPYNGHPLIELEIFFENSIVSTCDSFLSILTLAAELAKIASAFLKANYDRIPEGEKEMAANKLKTLSTALSELETTMNT